ncbi:MAG: adenosyl-hopene transferase HpnH [Alphaproteobacteria bacterium]|jgi:hopanoid biosynthesis associated radical SAM protein HpnH|nr:adenosyl-hopene transferase HpnH [Alphaproteobacteria bacterium]
MSVPLRQQFDIALYIFKQKIKGNKRYPLVLMLEPLFRCNLACPGCGKIDYPAELLNQRLSVEDCLNAANECGAPVVSLPGGEPLIHREMPQIVRGLIKQKRYVYLCTNALLLEKKLDEYEPSPYLTLSVHLDGGREDHDRSVNKEGVYDIAERAIKKAIEKGFRVNINSTLFNNADPKRQADFFDHMMDIGLNAIMLSPGYAYERAADQQHFLNRQTTKNLFRDIFKLGKERQKQGKTKWRFSQSSLFLDFLCGNQTYECTPWGTPTYNIFGWQRPCYLLGEGFAKSYKELMETTEWDQYGTGRYEKCADCMVHCGYEPTAAEDALAHPFKLMLTSLRGPRTDGPFAPDLDTTNQRPAEYVFSKHVEEALEEIKAGKARTLSGTNDDADMHEPGACGGCCENCCRR